MNRIGSIEIMGSLLIMVTVLLDADHARQVCAFKSHSLEFGGPTHLLIRLEGHSTRRRHCQALYNLLTKLVYQIRWADEPGATAKREEVNM